MNNILSFDNRRAGKESRRNMLLRRHTALFLILTMILGLSDPWDLKPSARAASEQERVLSCACETGTVSHVHNQDCYADGVLVCPLEEIEPHEHTDDCYEHVLSCGKTENEEHKHTEACYEIRLQLTCGLEEGEGKEAHRHTESCYEPVLICEKPVLPEHVHSEACFLLKESEPEPEPAAEDGNAEEEIVTAEETETPEADEEQETSETEKKPEEPEDAAEQTEALNAEEEIPAAAEEPGTDETPTEDKPLQGAVTDEAIPEESPAGESSDEETPAADAPAAQEEVQPDADATKESKSEEPMTETMIEDSEVPLAAPEEEPLTFTGEAGGVLVTVIAPPDAFPEGTVMEVTPVIDEELFGTFDSMTDGEVVSVQAVDITFICGGVEVEPAGPIQVTMTSPEKPKSDRQTVVHVDHNGETSVVEQKKSSGAEIVFEADQFSLYAVVYTVIEKTIRASDGETYRISVSYDEEAGIPDNAELAVEEILPDTEEYKAYIQMADETLPEELVSFARFFDITILVDGVEIQPTGPVDVKIELADELDETAKAVHFGEEVEVIEASVAEIPAETVEAATESGTELSNEVSFTAEGFSIYGIILTTLEKTIEASDGNTYEISLTYNAGTKLPTGAELSVEEILSDSEQYADYVNEAEETLGWETGSASYVRLFDITIVDTEGEKLQPREGTTVSVSIRLLDWEETGAETQVIHFGEEPEILENTTEGDTVAFEASAFSVYAIVEAPEVKPTVTNLGDLTEGQAYILSIVRNGTNYMTSRSVLNNRVYELAGATEASEGEQWYFEFPEEGKISLYYLDSEDNRNYLNVDEARNITFSDTPQALLIETTRNAEGSFYIYLVIGGKNYALSARGNRNFFFEQRNNGVNSYERVYITQALTDPYELDGKTYGIAYHNDTATCAALMSDAKTVGKEQHLAATDMLMRPDVLDNEGILMVAENSDITEWTFTCVYGDFYYITTQVDEVTKYLTIQGNNVTLADEPSEKSLFQVTTGTGTNSGKYHFTAGEYSLVLQSTANGFRGAKSTEPISWMNLVERSVLNDDDFTLYTARKISVSEKQTVPDVDGEGNPVVDEDGNPVTHEEYIMPNGAQVIIYTRVWNQELKKYEFFAVDHDGSLIRCYDTGDGIEWIGTKVNTALWDFTEYYNSDGTENYYYELQNTQYGNYIAPQRSSGVLFADKPVGINLNGRRYGENYTTIIAWDDDSYAYSGLKAENERLTACALSEAQDFYFALVSVKEPADVAPVTTVETVDSDAFGITMKMIDFNYPVNNGRDSRQTEVMGTTGGGAGLLSSGLNEAGYPTVLSNGRALSDLFTSDCQQVNHLFLQSVYNESGYFEYDSAQNYAYLNDDGTFKVYDQLGAITGTAEHNNTREHGQFMPYVDISAQKGYALDAAGEVILNRMDILGNELSDLNARKGEKLYLIGNNKKGVKGEEGGVDYYFGMEMEAGFTQTANGLDAWGHDIIFEFSGDDDFWLYVDGELIIDLGGVHSAQVGSVNFRTGEVKSSNGNSTLYSLFRNHYQERGMSEEAIETKLAEIFTKNENGQYVFQNYSNHTMRMFYMERGAGASNLHMRFNLAAVRPGTFLLSKTLSGTDELGNSLLEFPYQIWIENKADGQFHLLGEKAGEKDQVKYQGTSTSVRYAESYIPAGGTTEYQHVFFLKPDETAEVTMPEDAGQYYVVECGINPDVFEPVTINGDVQEGTATSDLVGNTPRRDYATEKKTLAERSKVDYDNHVREGAMRTLSITKLLYDSDGENRLHYPTDSTLFTFRLYLGLENADTENLPMANLYPYFIKDPDGNYCRRDAATKMFVPVTVDGQPVTEYSDLSEYLKTLKSAELEEIVFRTSPNGTIDQIPADFTVEVRDLIVGTKWKVEERDYEIPKGYTLRLEDGYTRVDGGEPVMHGTTPLSGVMAVDEDPRIDIRNQKGWGLTVEKIWTDQDFMAEHDPIYFAVYVKSGTEEEPVYSLLQDSVRQLQTTETSLYYFFGNLQSTTPFSNYIVREVTLSGDWQVAQDGTVTGYTDVLPIEDGAALTIGGTPVGGEYHDAEHGYTYTVTYAPGEQTTQNENVRTDVVTNSRPGIRMYKTDWSGEKLSGAVFTLKDSDGNNVAAESYTSRDSDGLITIAYLNDGSYTLTEIKTPKGYVALDTPMVITIESGEDGERITVANPDGTEYDSSLYTLTQATETEMATIVIRDRTVSLQMQKIDAGTGEPLKDVSFALYRQVKQADGTVRKDYLPMEGYEALKTDENGFLEKVTLDNLNAGTYYLTETEAAETYDLLEEDLCFTIGEDGKVTIADGDKTGSRLETRPGDGTVSYTIKIPNGKMKMVSFKKVDLEHPDDSPLKGAEFDLYQVAEDGTRAEDPYLSGLLSDENGLLTKDKISVFPLAHGTWHLVETKAPAGYHLRALPVVLVIGTDGIRYDEGTALSEENEDGTQPGVTLDSETGVYTVSISNTAGRELPNTGGIGTAFFTGTGGLISLLAVFLLLRRKRRAA